MSSGLQSGQNSDPADDEVIIEPPPERTIILERTARMVAKHGLEMEEKIMAVNGSNPFFDFLWSSDRYHAFYQKRLTAYRSMSEDEIRKLVAAPLRAPDRKVSRDPLRESHFPCIPPEGLTLKELALVKLTAQFVVRYGMPFYDDLVERVSMNPQFGFLEKSDRRFRYLTELVVAYSSVLIPSKRLSKKGACRKAVLEGFFQHVGLDKQDDGVEMAMAVSDDLHSFAGPVDFFAHMEEDELSACVPPPEHLPMMMNTPPQMQPGPEPKRPRVTFLRDMTNHHPGMFKMMQQSPVEPETRRQLSDGKSMGTSKVVQPSPVEPEPRRQLFDGNSSLTSDRECYLHPGTSKTTVILPNVPDGHVFEFVVGKFKGKNSMGDLSAEA